ncbi:hypothetical protein DFAR_730003 [Desulfarculales bacterium]
MEGMLKALKEQLDNPRSPGAGLRGKTGPNGEQVGHSQKKPPAQKQAGQGQTPAWRLAGGHRLPAKAWHGQITHHGPGLMPMNRRAPQPAHQRTHRHRQKLSRLRPEPHKACLEGY